MEDNTLLQQNIQMMGGDPFEQSNGVLEQLQQMQYSYGMFGNQWYHITIILFLRVNKHILLDLGLKIKKVSYS